MAERQSIATAPRDGTRVIVYWTDPDGQENESIAQYRAGGGPAAVGADWDADGWWTFIDSDTQKRITPDAWRPLDSDEKGDSGEDE